MLQQSLVEGGCVGWLERGDANIDSCTGRYSIVRLGGGLCGWAGRYWVSCWWFGTTYLPHETRLTIDKLQRYYLAQLKVFHRSLFSLTVYLPISYLCRIMPLA